MKVNADLHVHTRLSACAHSDALSETYIALCREKGLKNICFTDHFWDENVEGASGWYAPQNFAHVMELRKEIPVQPEGVHVMFGVETEFIGSKMSGKKGGTAAITPEVAANFEFVLVPPDHFHMKGYTIPAEVTAPDEIKEWFIANFMEVAALELGVPTGIAHPFVPMGFSDPVAVLAAFTDDDFKRCFAFAAEKNKSVEMNHDILHRAELLPYYRRIMTLAKGEGCKFHFGSDAHTPSSFTHHDEIAQFAEECGINENDMFYPFNGNRA